MSVIQSCCSFLLSILLFAYSVSGIYVHARDCVACQERRNQQRSFTHIRESHPRKPREDGAPFIWKSDANTTTGKAGPVESAVIQ